MSKQIALLLVLIGCQFPKVLAGSEVKPAEVRAPTLKVKPIEYAVKDYRGLFKIKELSKDLIEMHLKIYEQHVKSLNRSIAQLAALRMGGQAEGFSYVLLKRQMASEWNGMRLHELFFDQLGGEEKLNMEGALYQMLSTSFGSFESWKKDFMRLSASAESGWVVAGYDPIESQVFNIWLDAQNQVALVGTVPLLVLDVEEHAYLPQFGLDRQKYLQTFFNKLKWGVIEQRFSGNGSSIDAVSRQ
ncbi:MAG: chrC [Chlamydiales bacterium]|jgi:Fe-Mn family superoxide dismutase|nr:chrC [Chlamydiales bacterium]